MKAVRVTCYISAGVILILLAGWIVSNFIHRSEGKKTLDEVEVTDSAEVSEIVYKYGIPVDAYNVRYGVVENNQNLSVLLREHGMSIRDVHELNENAEGVFDVRKIRSGQAYAVFFYPVLFLYHAIDP